MMDMESEGFKLFLLACAAGLLLSFVFGAGGSVDPDCMTIGRASNC